MNDERHRRVSYAYAHLAAAVEKLRVELEAQGFRRSLLAEEREGTPFGEAQRAFESRQAVDREAEGHVQLALEALGLAEREDAGIARAVLMGRRYDDRPPEEVLAEAERRREAHNFWFGMQGARPDDFDPDGEEEA